MHMKKYLLFVSFVISITAAAQNVGIGNTNPQAALDLQGDLRLRSTLLTLPAGLSNNVNLATVKSSVYSFAGEALGGCQIGGFTGGVDGRLITIFNNSATAAIQLYNENNPVAAASAAANRILTGSGNSAIIYQNGSATLRYDGTKQRWTIISSNYTDGLSTSGGGSDQWNVTGNDIFNANTGNVGIGTNSTTSKLTILGSTAVGNAPVLDIRGYNPMVFFKDGSNGAIGYIRGVSNVSANNPEIPATGLEIGVNNPGSLFMGTNNKTVVTIDQNHFVGIGTVAPISTLDVRGTTNISGNTIGSGSSIAGALTSGGGLFIKNSTDSKYLVIDGSQLQAQNFTGSSNIAIPFLINPFGGNVGIGLFAPSNKLTVLSSTINSAGNTDVLQIAGKNPLLNITDGNGAPYAYIKGITSRAGTPQFARDGIEIGTGGGDIYLTAQGYQPALMVKGDNNNVGIGTSNPTSKLSVNGNIRSKEVVVETGWADYVFDDGYKLPSLQVVEKYIDSSNHLPGIPSALDIQTNGLKLGELQTKMMAKIEELTLYVIKLNKEIELLKNKK